MTNEAALSRRMLARARDGSADSDARAFLQKRIEVYSRVLFWAFVALRIFEVLVYATYPQIKPRLYEWIFTTGIVGLAAMGVCWRGLLVRRTLTLAVLGRIELAYTASSGLVFGVTALLAYDRHESAYTCLVYGCFLVFTRALVVPSSGTLTAKVSALALAPLVVAAGVLAAETEQEIPGAAYFACAVIYCGIAVTLASAGSRFIYGLRRRVREHARLGQYTLDRKIGEGGMGVVYSARHALLRRRTALKLLHPHKVGAGTLDRFELEVRRMSQLTHPNAVAVFDYGHSPDGVFYYVMEFLDGVDLETLVRKHGPQPLARVINILAQVCGALQEAHLRGLVHRDIKPANIILCERGGNPDVAKVVDYGLAPEHITESLGHTIYGTPAYLAPEAISAPAHVGPSADLYAVGAVAYFLLTGRCVFEGSTVAELCRQHVEARPVAPGIGPAVDDLILRCLAKDPSRRPASAAALARELRALAIGEPWDVTSAHAWWRGFRADQCDQVVVAPSLHITVDMRARRASM